MELMVSAAADRISEAFGSGKLQTLVRERRVEIARGLLADLPPLAAAADIEAVLESHAAGPESVRIFAGRTCVDLETMNLRKGDALNLEALRQIMAQGGQAVIQPIEPHVPAIGALAAAISQWLDEDITVGAVLTHGERSGLKPHHDMENVLIVQIAGAKRWTLLGDPVAPGLNNDDVTEETGPETQFVLEAGDVMFLPAGQRHVCLAEGASLHIGILIRHRKAADLADEFADLMREDAALRAPFLRFMPTDDRRSAVAKARARLHELVDELDFAARLSERPKAE